MNRCQNVLIFILVSLVHAEDIEQKLIDHLLTNVTRYARPVTHPSDHINATFGIELVQLVKVDEREQLITTKVWVRQTWTTGIFKWNTAEWGGIKEIRIDADQIWIPDIVLYNNGDSVFSGGTEKYGTLVSIDWQGRCTWLAPATFISNCEIDIRDFPFDKQKCVLKFGSWTFDAKGINLTTDENPLITNQFTKSAEWSIEKASKIVNAIRYDCCPNPFIDVTFEFVILRKSVFYVFNIVAPCIILVVALLFGFFLPPESGERIALIIIILLAVAVFLQLVSDSLPRNSDNIPTLAVFYMVVMMESTLSLIVTCIILNFHYRGLESNSAPMPKWVKRFFLQRMANLMGVKRHSVSEEEDETMTVIKNLANINYFMKTEKSNDESCDTECSSTSQTPSFKALADFSAVDNNLNTSILATILKELKVISANAKEQERQGEIQDDWKFLARVLDRIFFWLFLLTVSISCIAILLPSYFEQH